MKTSYSMLFGSNKNLDQYDAVEVHPCINMDDNTELIEEQEIGENPHASYFWAVYLHLKAGGIESVADVSSKEAAVKLAEALEYILITLNGNCVIQRYTDPYPIEKLMDEYGEENPVWTRESWAYEANNRYTQLGYWEWVKHQIESEKHLEDVMGMPA